MSWNFNDTQGIGLPNWAYGNLIPIALLQKAFIPMVRMWDSKWEPAIGQVMPRMRGDPKGGDHFSWPLIVDSQPIANMLGPYGRVDYLTTGMDAESWSTQKTAEGFMMEPEEFLPEFTSEAAWGTSQKMQRLTQLCVRAIERRVELELVNYLYGHQPCIQAFSNQLTLRQLNVDATSNANGMIGSAWNDYVNSDPFRDIDNIIELQESMGDEDLDTFFIGTKTAKVLKNHDIIIERLKYVRDLAGGTLNAWFGGLPNSMKIVKVKHHTFKEEAANVGTIGSPGLGDTAADYWNNRNKYWFMRSGNYEFSFLTSSTLGFTFTSRCNQFHSGDGLYTYSWVDHEPHFVRTRFELKFAPGVKDFANMALIRNVCPTTA